MQLDLRPIKVTSGTDSPRPSSVQTAIHCTGEVPIHELPAAGEMVANNVDDLTSQDQNDYNEQDPSI
ncbi:hypothetical protein PoB_000726400 [Plakobranchus ocellatus]|uniref:Uncharacterized protein n=1 Tax=Plakobranchus ocellatus TaxID=259542 RepID=A0AAV3YCJ6_9GAST|nr:hypothetical protein PoB_000726400 [Plakobranchus ocellatus]